MVAPELEQRLYYRLVPLANILLGPGSGTLLGATFEKTDFLDFCKFLFGQARTLFFHQVRNKTQLVQPGGRRRVGGRPPGVHGSGLAGGG